MVLSVKAEGRRIMGSEHPDTLLSQDNLANSYRQAGRTADAIAILEQVAADRARIVGPEHPDTAAAVNALWEWKRRPRLRGSRR